MEKSLPEPENAVPDQNPKLTEKSEEKEGVFSRPDYAKKDFWNGRFQKF